MFATTIIKSFSILNCFRDDRQELGISDIAAKVGMPVSSVHRIIQSLEFERLLFQNPENKKYYLGSSMLMLAKKCDRYQRFEKIAIRHVDKLGEITGENVNLTVCSAGRISHVYTKESQFVLRPNFPPHLSFPACNTSVGRIFLSAMNRESMEWVYDTYKDEIRMSKIEFVDMLNRFKKLGYALDDEEFSAGLRCVAAPVRLFDDNVIFAISISAPISRMDDERYAQSAKLIVECADLISQQIQASE